jgi:tRNA (adenine22-N1)-methyltransferase
MTYRTIRPDARLTAVAAQVREGITLYDVGTDHAYLPVYLMEQGRISHAVASDVAEGPLASAKETVAMAGLADRIETVLSDGLRNVTLVPPCDVTIAGMGGDLMARILSEASAVKDGDVRLILQPMTKAPYLREFLLGSGFCIIDESLADDDRIYQVICAEYCGEREEYSPVELLLGRHNIARGGELFGQFVEQNVKIFEGIRAGKASGGADTSYEDGILNELNALLQVKK